MKSFRIEKRMGGMAYALIPDKPSMRKSQLEQGHKFGPIEEIIFPLSTVQGKILEYMSSCGLYNYICRSEMREFRMFKQIWNEG